MGVEIVPLTRTIIVETTHGSRVRQLDRAERMKILTKEGLVIPSQISKCTSESGWAYLDNLLPDKSLRHNLHEITAEFHNPNRKDSVSGPWDPHGSDMYHGARGGQMGRKLGQGRGTGGGSQVTTQLALYKRSVNHIKFAPRQDRKSPFGFGCLSGGRCV